MKVRYYGYTIRNVQNEDEYCFDLAPYLGAFCKTNPALQQDFIYEDEYLYLIAQDSRNFLFFMTRNKADVEKLIRTNISIENLTEQLADDESIGFSARLFFAEKGRFFAFGSPMYAPKVPILAAFINMLLEKISVVGYEFCIKPLVQKTTREQALDMEFLGRTVIELDKNSSMYQQTLNQLGFETNDIEDVSTIEITIKPKRNKNIKSGIKKIFGIVSDSGVEKFKVAAREELGHALTEIYLDGRAGHLYDDIDFKKNRDDLSLIKAAAENNPRLKEQLNRTLETSETVTPSPPSAFDGLDNVDAWTNRLSVIQSGNQVQS